MSQLDFQLQAFNSYIDGFGKLGSGEKVSTPKIKKAMEKYRGGGMLVARQRAMGYEPFEMDYEFSSYDPQIIRQGGLFSRASVPLSTTAAFDGDRNERHVASFTCRGTFMEVDPGTWEAGKKAMLKCKAALDALKLVMDGVVIYDIDVEADKYIIGGVDEYAWIRAAL